MELTMGWYKAQWAYKSSLWPEPITAGKLLDITDEQAAMLNADSPGVVVAVKVAEVKDEPKAEPKAERAVDKPPRVMARKAAPSKRARDE